MDRDDRARCDRPQVVDGLGHLQPRRAAREQQRRQLLDARRDVGVAGVQERAVDEVAVVRHQRDVRVDLRMVPGPDDGHLGATEGQHVAGGGGAGVDAVQLLGGLAVGDQGGVGVGAQQGAQPVRVDVVEVLVGDQDRVQAVEGLEAGGERPRSNNSLADPVSTRTQAWP